MMSVTGCPTKKVLKSRIGQEGSAVLLETSLFGPEFKADGVNIVVGPSPYMRKWYAQVTCRAGSIVKVA